MLEKLKAIISKVMPDLNVEGVNEKTNLVSDLCFDSLAIMMLAMNIENEFGIRFDGPVNFATVGDVINYLEKNIQK